MDLIETYYYSTLPGADDSTIDKIEENVAKILGSWGKIPITYAGGVKDLSDIEKLKKIGKGKVDVTVGSALDIFGGPLKMENIISACQ